MTGLTVSLALAYVTLLAVLVSIWLHGRQAVWVKTAAAVLVFFASVAAYQGWREVTGWPATEVVPAQFLLLSSWVREPDQATSSAGGIDLWLVSVSEQGPALHPRAYSLPYDTQLHQAVEAAERRMGQGRLQMGRRVLEGGRRTTASAVRRAPDQLLIEFYDMPDPALPEK